MIPSARRPSSTCSTPSTGQGQVRRAEAGRASPGRISWNVPRRWVEASRPKLKQHFEASSPLMSGRSNSEEVRQDGLDGSDYNSASRQLQLRRVGCVNSVVHHKPIRFADKTEFTHPTGCVRSRNLRLPGDAPGGRLRWDTRTLTVRKCPPRALMSPSTSVSKPRLRIRLRPPKRIFECAQSGWAENPVGD